MWGIQDEYRINKKKTQLDKDGYEYIMNNYEKIDTILNYDVYKYKEDYDWVCIQCYE